MITSELGIDTFSFYALSVISSLDNGFKVSGHLGWGSFHLGVGKNMVTGCSGCFIQQVLYRDWLRLTQGCWSS